MSNEKNAGLNFNKKRVINFRGESITLDMEKTYRANKQVVISAWCEEGPYATFSVCLADEIVLPGYTFLDTNNLPDINDALVSQGVVELTDHVGHSGYCTYPLVRVI